MNGRSGDEENKRGGPGSSVGVLRPLWQGLAAAGPVALTVVLAVFLATQEEVLVAGRGGAVTAPAIATAPLPSLTVLVAPATSTRDLATAVPILGPVTKAPPTATSPRARPRRTEAPTSSCVKRWDWVSYTIQLGDTLSSIALRYGLSVQALKNGNCLNTDRIYAGGTLLVPWLPRPEPTKLPTPRPRPTRTSSPTPRPTAIGSETPSPTATESPTTEPGTNTPTVVPPTAEPTDTPHPPTSTPTPIPPTQTPAPTHTSPPPTNTPVPPTDTPSG